MIRHRFSERVIKVVLLSWAFSVVFSTHVWASDIQSVYFPVAAKLDLGDEQTILCDMWFECRAIRYNIPLASFRQASRLPAEHLLPDILEMLRLKDIEAIQNTAYWGQNGYDEKAESRMQFLLQIYEQLLDGNINDYVVEYQVFIGRRRTFYLKQNHSTLGVVCIPIGIVEIEPNSVRWDMSDEETDKIGFLNAMIRDSLEQSFRRTVSITPAADRVFDHSLLLTTADAKYPAYLLFNGKDFTDREYLSMEDAADQAVSLVWTRHSLVKTGNKDKIGALYTPRSRQIYDGIMNRGVLAEYDWFIRIWQRPPQIEYVIDANPLYVPVRKTSSGFAFEYVFRNTENDSERFQLTNFQGRDFFVRLLMSDHFASEFVKSLASNKQVQSQPGRDQE